MRSDHAFALNILVSYYIFIKYVLYYFICKNLGVCSAWGELITLPHFLEDLAALSPLVSFIIFEIFFHVAAITENIFCVQNGVSAPFSGLKVFTIA